MRKIEAIIRKSKFKYVKSALLEKGFENFNYHLTRSSARTEHRYYRGTEYDAQAEERVKLTLYVDPKSVQSVLDIIQFNGDTGSAQESYIGIYKPEYLYKLIDENGKDRLIQVI